MTAINRIAGVRRFTLCFLLFAPLLATAAVPDVIYVNGTIVTVNEENPQAEALAIKGDRIVAVGSTRKIRSLAGDGTRVIDLDGATMLPGFYDNHIHLGGPLQPWKWGGMIDKVPDWLRDVSTIPELQEAIAGQVATLPDGAWIVGDIPREDWPNPSLPTRWDFDKVSPKNPVVIARGPHTLIVNSMALELAGVTGETRVNGGQITLDENGEPTGKILESAAKVIEAVMPGGGSHSHRGPASPEEDAEKLAEWKALLDQLVSLGVTSVNVAGVRTPSLPLVQKLYDQWGDTLPRMAVQLRVSPGYDTHEDVVEGARQAIAEIDAIGVPADYYQHPKLKLGGLKMSIDGGLSAPVFWSTKPYENRPDFYGVQRIPDKTFWRVAQHAHDAGWQLGIHTMGDAAVEMVVNELKTILETSPRPDHRHYLHHVAVKPPEHTLELMGEYHINVASQPGFLLSLGSYADEALEPERQATQNPSRSLLDHGIRVSYGSDAGPYGPIAVIFAAVTRTGWNGEIHGPEEAVSIEEAIAMHTVEPAYFTFDEQLRGSIEPGKLADLVVLDRNPLSIPPEDLPQVQVLKTVIGGKTVFQRN